MASFFLCHQLDIDLYSHFNSMPRGYYFKGELCALQKFSIAFQLLQLVWFYLNELTQRRTLKFSLCVCIYIDIYIEIYRYLDIQIYMIFIYNYIYNFIYN